MTKVFIQWICRAQPHCRCTGAKDECDCFHNPKTHLCIDCGEPMEEIDFETGEAPRKAVAS